MTNGIEGLRLYKLLIEYTMRKVLFFLFMFLSLLRVEELYAQGAGDEVLGETYRYVGKVEGAAISAEAAAVAGTMYPMGWLNGQTKKYNGFKEKYYAYLDSLQAKLLIAANVVGLGMEVYDLSKSIKLVKNELSENPGHFAAVMLDRYKNDVVLDAINLVGQLYDLIVNRAKVKETKRYEPLEKIRLKIREVNNKLIQLARYIRYSNFQQIWYEIMNNYHFIRCDKRSVALKCRQRWLINAGSKRMDW